MTKASYQNIKIPLYFIILYAILVRFFLFFTDRALWLDETLLARNILEKSFFELLGKLDYSQMAPGGFLLAGKLMVFIFGTSEWVFRLLPFLLSIAGVFLFVHLAKKFLSGAILNIAVLIWATSPYLIRYSAEFKQYSFDVFFTLLLLVIAMYAFEQKYSITSSLLLLFTGIIAIWFSFPIIFVLGGIGVFFVFFLFQQKNWKAMVMLAFSGVVWIVLYYLSIRVTMGAALNGSGMNKFFTSLYPPFPITSTAHIKWYIEQPGIIFSNPAGFQYPGLAAVLFLIGCSPLFKKKPTYWLLASPLLITILAAFLQKYPIHDRLILFWTPVLFIFIASGIQIIRDKTSASAIWIAPVIVLLIKPLIFSLNPILSPSFYPEVRETLTTLTDQIQPNDRVYIYYKAEPSFWYYGSEKLKDHSHLTIGQSARNDWLDYLSDINSYQGESRVWFYFSHICKWRGVDEKQLFLKHLDNNGTRLQAIENDGAWLYLYDLTSHE